MTTGKTLRGARTIAIAAVFTAGGVLALSARQAAPDPQAAVTAAFNKYRTLKEGKNADYIPALAKVSPDLFGLPSTRRTARSTPRATSRRKSRFSRSPRCSRWRA
jgi:hypothetical protein